MWMGTKEPSVVTTVVKIVGRRIIRWVPVVIMEIYIVLDGSQGFGFPSFGSFAFIAVPHGGSRCLPMLASKTNFVATGNILQLERLILASLNLILRQWPSFQSTEKLITPAVPVDKWNRRNAFGRKLTINRSLSKSRAVIHVGNSNIYLDICGRHGRREKRRQTQFNLSCYMLKIPRGCVRKHNYFTTKDYNDSTSWTCKCKCSSWVVQQQIFPGYQ